MKTQRLSGVIHLAHQSYKMDKLVAILRLSEDIHLAPWSYKMDKLVATQWLSEGIHLANSSGQVGVHLTYEKMNWKMNIMCEM
jgi:hypothetical protein